jgi:hypothetical protein
VLITTKYLYRILYIDKIMAREDRQTRMLKRVGASAQHELQYILGEKDVLKRFYLLTDLQKRTGQCVEDCIRDNIPVSKGLNYADKRARAELQKFYSKYGGILDKLGIEEPKTDYRAKRTSYNDGLDVIVRKTKH